MISYKENLRYDIPASIVVFLVALPLCLGIALASGAPLFSGLIAGISGGIVVGFLSGSQLSVSGPAAGLTVIVLSAIERLGAYETFLMAVVLGGLFQFILGSVKAGIIGHFFPSAVIKGMLSAIGLILILKQIPHALGDDQDYEGDDAFWQPDGENTFTEIVLAVQNIDPGALIIALTCLIVLVMMDRFKWNRIVPGPLVAVVLAVVINEVLYGMISSDLVLRGVHLVSLPVAEDFEDFVGFFTLPDFSQLANPQVYVTAATIALIASLETLLSLDAVDKLDPFKRIAPTNRELKAQGIGNMVSGLVGGLPITAVIVRSTANVSSGGRTKVSAIVHGFLLLFAVAFIPTIINLIPLAALAAILLQVGWKLTKPALYKQLYAQGWDQFAPFVITILAILFTDLLKGITIGIIVGIAFVIKANLHQAITVKVEGNKYIIKLQKDVSFLNKAFLRRTLKSIPDNSIVVFDGSKAVWVDHDIIETIEDFKATAESEGIAIEIVKSEEAKTPIFTEVE
ncbi:MAG: SulP family inorganic anion transporter [Bacteroidota bacterium]